MLDILFSLVGSSGPMVTHQIPVTRDSLAFSIEVPRTWGYSDEGFGPLHYRWVQVCANSSGVDSLRLLILTGAWSKGRGWDGRGPEAFVYELSPGTVYVELAICGAPGGLSLERPYLWSEDLGPSARVERAATTRTPSRERDGLMLYEVGFVRWGRPWEAVIAAQKPFAAADLDAAFAILKSLKFPDHPVRDPHQAVEIVIPSIPMYMRPQEDWLEDCAYRYFYRVHADTSGSGFEVSFRVLDGTSDARVVRSMDYYVGREGDVISLPRK